MRTKMLLLAALAAVGVAASRKAADRRADHDLWREATDPVDLR